MAPSTNVAIHLSPQSPGPALPWGKNVAARFAVFFQGLLPGQRVELTFWETDGTANEKRRSQREIGKLAGVAAKSSVWPSRQTLIVDAVPPPPQASTGTAQNLVEFLFTSPAGGVPTVVTFDLSLGNVDKDEGEAWELSVCAENLGLETPTQLVSRVRRALAPGTEATYQHTEGNHLKMYNDGCTDERGTDGAFRDLLDAIKGAKRFIFIADWSFHPLFRASRVGEAERVELKNTIGALLIEKAKQGVLVAIHTWNHTNRATPDEQNDNGKAVLKLLGGGSLPSTLLWRASAHDTSTMSHHQKFVVLDAPAAAGSKRVIQSFFGGLDLTEGRFDHPGHPVGPPPGEGGGDKGTWMYAQKWKIQKPWFERPLELEGLQPPPIIGDDPFLKAEPEGWYYADEWYNAEFGGDRTLPRQPWHDIHGHVTGPSAWDFVREFVGRWACDPDWIPTLGDNSGKGIGQVHSLFQSLFDAPDLVKPWEPHDGPFAAQVLRSILRSHWDDKYEIKLPDAASRAQGRQKELHWSLTRGFEDSIQRSYLRAIDQAEHFIYIETQYFIGSGNKWGEDKITNQIPERLVKRIQQRRAEGAPFHVYIVFPMFPEGDPGSRPLKEQRWLSWRGIEWMIKTLGKSWQNNLSFYFPASWQHHTSPPGRKPKDRQARVRASNRYMIYVHSKLMLVDDRFAIFGSANLNERSLAGSRDTEIGCAFWPMLGREEEAVSVLRSFRRQLWREHLGQLPPGWEEGGSSACATLIKEITKQNYVAFRSWQRLPNNGQLCNLPLKLGARDRLEINAPLRGSDESPYVLPDSPEEDRTEAEKVGWGWSAPGSVLIRKSGIAE